MIGASDTPGKVGYTVLHNLKQQFPGLLVPVNSHQASVQGLPAVKHVGDAQGPLDLAVICTPAAGVPQLVRECGQAGIRGIVILSAGFREVGAAGRQLEQDVAAAKAEFPGMRLIGPNCLGVLAPHSRLNASFAATSPRAGNVAFVSQSGALCTAVLDWAAAEEIGFSYFVSIGNMLDVGFGDLLDYCGADPRTDAIVLYVESISSARQFMSAARAVAQHKPIVVYKAGRYAQSAQAAASHTGAMAGVDAVYDAALRRAGAVRVGDLDDLFDCAELLARKRLPSGPRLAIVTNAGGPGVIATDALLLARKGTLAELSPELKAQLDAALPSCWSHGNPIDILGDATPERFGLALGHALADRGVDAALVLLSPQAMTDPTGSARAVSEATAASHKPVLAAWLGGELVQEGAHLLKQKGVPTYATPEHAIRALTYLDSYRRNLEVLYETPREIPLDLPLDRTAARDAFRQLNITAPTILSEQQSKQLLAAYGIPTTQPMLAQTARAAVAEADRQSYPVVLKIASPDITHKTDVGGVALDLADSAAVAAAYDRLLATARASRPDARLDGVTVQRMIDRSGSVELIVGAKQDPVFGAVVLVGMGGITAELLNDRALELPPLDGTLARRMLESLQLWPLLAGYRGRQPVDVDRLVEVLVRFSYLVTDFPEFVEIDVNPLLVGRGGTMALDARIVVDPTRSGGARRFSHLAICPYPSRYVRQVQLRDGTQVLLRPIKPEDEPRWRALHARSSPETIWARFQSMFKEATHDMAMRFCFLDYDRDLSIVAEVPGDPLRQLIGVASLTPTRTTSTPNLPSWFPTIGRAGDWGD